MIICHNTRSLWESLLNNVIEFTMQNQMKANLNKLFTFYLDIDLDGKRDAFFEVFGFLIEVFTECAYWDASLE